MIGLMRRRGLGVATAAACTIPLVPMLLWMLFCHRVTGHWLPNTYYLKASAFQFSPSQLLLAWRAVSLHGYPSLWTYVVGLAACVTFFRPGWQLAIGVCLLMLVAAPAAYAVGVVGTRHIILDGGGYYFNRWVDPASLVLTIPFCLGCAAVVGLVVRPERLASWSLRGGRQGEPAGRNRSAAQGTSPPRPAVRRQSRRERAQSLHRRKVLAENRPWSGRQLLAVRAAGIAVLLLLVSSIPQFGRSFADRRWQLSSDSRAINLLNVAMGKWIGSHAPEDAVLAVSDAGAIRYFGQRHTIDLAGLNNSDVAFARMSPRDVLERVDWLAIIPGWYQDTRFMKEVLRNFEPRFETRIPAKEYTICDSPESTVQVAYRKKGPASAPMNADQ